MHIFIDESGIHKDVDHSVFALAYIEVAEYESLSTQVIELERRFGIEYFHWSSTVWKVKESFVHATLELPFVVKAAVLKNPIHPQHELEDALRHLIIERHVTSVSLEGKKPKWFERKIKKVLKDKGVSVQKLRTVRPSESPGVRLADMCAGLVRSHFDKPADMRMKALYQELEPKLTLLVFPPGEIKNPDLRRGQ